MPSPTYRRVGFALTVSAVVLILAGGGLLALGVSHAGVAVEAAGFACLAADRVVDRLDPHSAA